MKKNIRILMLLILSTVLSESYAQENEGKIVVEITKEINGEKKTFKGEYNNREEMETDPNYQEFAGKSNSFHFWTGDDDPDVFLQLDQLKDLKNHFQFFDDDGFNSSFFHELDGDSSSSAFNFHFDNFSSQEFSEELMERMKDFGVEMEEILERLSDEGDGKSIQIITLKRVKISDVDDEFGKKGTVEQKELLQLEDLTFYPNPSSDGRIKVRFTVPEEEELEIKISDLNGKEVFTRYFERFSGLYTENIDLSRQKEGMYLLEIIQGKRRVTKKVVIE